MHRDICMTIKTNQTNTIKENLNDGNNLEITPERPMKQPVNAKRHEDISGKLIKLPLLAADWLIGKRSILHHLLGRYLS